MAYLFLCHRVVFLYFFDDNYSEILVKGVAGLAEVLIDIYRFLFLCVVPMFVYSAIALLRLQFADVLTAVTASVAPCDVDRIF